MASEKKSVLAERVRKALKESGATAYQIAKDSGLNQMAVYRFMSGETEGTLWTFEKLLDYLGAEVNIPKASKRKG